MARKKTAPTPIENQTEEVLETEHQPQAFNPRYEAHRLRLTGLDWHSIAAQTGYSSGTQAQQAVKNYLQQAAQEMDLQKKQDALITEIDRYHAVLNAWWERGTTGHNKGAAETVLKTLSQLDKILRLSDPDTVVTEATVVISGDREQYLAQLQNFVEEREGDA